MEISKQTQTAGDNSIQTTVGTINVYQGITEARAREICNETYAVIARDMTQEAVNTASERVSQLADILLPKMVSYDKQLSAFADPAYQLALRKAQLSAACTDEASDYELLSELLLERAKIKEEDKNKQLGISKALEIVGQISDSALLGLSVMYIAVRLRPVAEDLHQALQVYNQVYAKIIGEKILPAGNDWMDELDLLMAIRINVLGIKKSQQYFSERFSNHLVSGIEKDSEDFERIKNELEAAGLPVNAVLISHPLKPNFVKLVTNQDVKNIQVTRTINGLRISTPLNPVQQEVLQKVADELRRDESNLPERQKAFMQEWDKYPYLKTIREWWDALDYAPTLTRVGLALANAYIRTIDPSIPKVY